MRRLNPEKVRNHRIKHLQRYEVQYVDRDSISDIVEMEDMMNWIMSEMKERFEHKMRRRHMWTKKPFSIDTYIEYDIDYNRYRFIVREHFFKERRRQNDGQAISASREGRQRPL